MPISSDESPTLRLVIQGKIPSFKTGKFAAINRETRRPMVVTKGDHKRWMKHCVESIVSALGSSSEIAGVKIRTESHRRSLIASLLPEDDSWREIAELTITTEEGPLDRAVIEIRPCSTHP